MWLVGVDTQPFLPLGFVRLVVAIAPDDAAFTLESEDVRRDPIEEPAIVADYDGASAEFDQSFLEGP